MLRYLLWIPAVVYALSYLYLAWYHRQINIITTIIHEGGVYTFIDTVFYASHCLGHIPVHTTVALFLTGSYWCLTDKSWLPEDQLLQNRYLVLMVLLFLVATTIVSIQIFGVDDTRDYICQRKQSLVVMGNGGSWNLHLPSTMMLFVFVPPYTYLIKRSCRRRASFNPSGLVYIGLGGVLLLGMTLYLNPHPVAILNDIWSSPRYLGHSVRELLTFPLTYFPIPLYFFLKQEPMSKDLQSDQRVIFVFWMFSLMFLIGVAYQAAAVLAVGIGETAQTPPFAKDGKLSILYLLSSHYFEHFLDTVYFSLCCLLLYRCGCPAGSDAP